MTKQEKRLAKMKNNPKGVRPEELEAILLSFGFKARSAKGDHRYYTKSGHIVGLDFGRSPVKPVYVKIAIEAIEATL